MPASRKRPSRTRMRRAKRESDPLSSDDPASRPTRLDYHQFLATHLGVIEDLLTTLQVYLRDLTASDTLLVRLGRRRTGRSSRSAPDGWRPMCRPDRTAHHASDPGGLFSQAAHRQRRRTARVDPLSGAISEEGSLWRGAPSPFRRCCLTYGPSPFQTGGW